MLSFLQILLLGTYIQLKYAYIYNIYIYRYIEILLVPATVTTRIITFLAGDSHKTFHLQTATAWEIRQVKLGSFQVWCWWFRVPRLLKKKKHVLPRKITYPLKIDGWKMRFPFTVVPFQGTC